MCHEWKSAGKASNALQACRRAGSSACPLIAMQDDAMARSGSAANIFF